MWQVTPEHQIRERWRAGPFLRKAARILSSIVVLGGVVFFTLSFFPNLWPGGGTHAAPATARLMSMSRIAKALRTYAADNDGRLPARFSTNEDLRAAIAPYDLHESVFEAHNPNGGQIVPNPQLAGISWNEVSEPEAVALLFETKLWRGRSSFCAFLDASAKWVSAKSVIRLDPDISNEDGAKERRFRVAMTDYRITESGGPTFEVTIEKWVGKRWAVQYEGASILEPIIRWEPYEVLVYLRQPPKEIDGETQEPVFGYYELVSVDKNGVRLKPAEAWTLYQ
ncbi:MAG: hypothetical protein IH944_14490 [Armatimonadetes bacterium]|nr:hypothetical protein [Armatimonadota bacterium]